jgi:tRNA A37 threonylcarbamoyladenosine synthetase subunit TsaC/SUA5/YrdC
LDLIIDCGPCGAGATTMINLAGGAPELIRAGKGSLTPFGFD